MQVRPHRPFVPGGQVSRRGCVGQSALLPKGHALDEGRTRSSGSRDLETYPFVRTNESDEFKTLNGHSLKVSEVVSMVKSRCVIGIGLVCLVFQITSSRAVSGTSLSDLASSMAPGTWKEVTDMSGFKIGQGYIVDDQTASHQRSILEFSDKAVWDAVSKRFLFYGGR